MTDKSRKTSTVTQLWLILYNVAMTSGWFLIGVEMIKHAAANKSQKVLYEHVEKLLLFFQTAAILEVVHAAFGMVRSNVLLTFLQVLSRVGIVWGVIQPIVSAQNNIGFSMLLFAWTITEIIRYAFYTFLLLGVQPYLILWMRYTLFIVLYPIGVTGELLTIYNSLGYVRESGMYSISLPNKYNFSLDYYYVLLGTFPMYLTFFPQLYFHMFTQRKKSLGPQSTSKKEN